MPLVQSSDSVVEALPGPAVEFSGHACTIRHGSSNSYGAGSRDIRPLPIAIPGITREHVVPVSVSRHCYAACKAGGVPPDQALAIISTYWSSFL